MSRSYHCRCRGRSSSSRVPTSTAALRSWARLRQHGRGSMGIALGHSRTSAADASLGTKSRSAWALRLVPALLVALAFVLQAAFAQPASAEAGVPCPQTGIETVASDQAEYAPGSIVHITGTGYGAGCDVVMKVTRPDGSVVRGDGSFEPGSDTVTTDLLGELSYDY